MKNVVMLLAVVGIVFAAWKNWEKIMGLVKPSAPAEEIMEDGTPVVAGSSAAPTPHPAQEAQAAATKAYPALSMPNSAFNKKFLALHAEARRNEPGLLARSDWPLALAERTAIALGGAPMPVPGTPAPVRPSGLQGSALDRKPKK